MTSIAVTASIWASASEAALLVASFMSNSLDLGMTHRHANDARTTAFDFYSEHPATSIRSRLSPHSANIDSLKIDQQCGGNLARAQPVCARVGAIFQRPG